jgi:hypothetical protein
MYIFQFLVRQKGTYWLYTKMETPMCYYWPCVSWSNRLPHVRGMREAWWIGARGALGHIGKPVGDCGGVMSERIDGDSCG